MTVFNVAGLLREPPGTTRRVALHDDQPALGTDVVPAGPLAGELRLQRTNRGILVTGAAAADVRRTCARCLDAYVEEARISVSEEFVPSIDPESGAQLDPSEMGEGVQAISAHHEIDLGPVLHEEFSLTEPMHPLCRPDCAGLCAVCGERLGEGHPAHAADEMDPRLAGLASLLGRDEITQ